MLLQTDLQYSIMVELIHIMIVVYHWLHSVEEYIEQVLIWFSGTFEKEDAVGFSIDEVEPNSWIITDLRFKKRWKQQKIVEIRETKITPLYWRGKNAWDLIKTMDEYEI